MIRDQPVPVLPTQHLVDGDRHHVYKSNALMAALALHGRARRRLARDHRSVRRRQARRVARIARISCVRGDDVRISKGRVSTAGITGRGSEESNGPGRDIEIVTSILQLPSI